MDNHHIYVIENSSPNPLEGEFVMKGRIKTDKDDNWAIHASTFEHQGQRYLIGVDGLSAGLKQKLNVSILPGWKIRGHSRRTG